MKTFWIVALICIGSAAQSQTRDSLLLTTPDEEKIFFIVDQLAEFPGGQGEMIKFLQQNIVYPPDAKKAKIQGKVFVKFVIGKDGAISGIEVMKGVSPLLDEEAIRVVSLFHDWLPAKHEGRIVRSQFVLPIYFQLTK